MLCVDVRCLVLVARCLSFVVCRSSFGARYRVSLFVLCCMLFVVVCYVLWIMFGLRCCLLFVACCALFVVVDD